MCHLLQKTKKLLVEKTLPALKLYAVFSGVGGVCLFNPPLHLPSRHKTTFSIAAFGINPIFTILQNPRIF
jgi:hypothetical protein